MHNEIYKQKYAASILRFYNFNFILKLDPYHIARSKHVTGKFEFCSGLLVKAYTTL